MSAANGGGVSCLFWTYYNFRCSNLLMIARKIALERHLRKTMTEPERLLWARLKLREDGVVFKRQHAIGPYILDFFCHKAQLAIEIDGSLHGTAQAEAHDSARDAYFERLGIFTYRVSAFEVYRDADAVADGIRLIVTERVNQS